MKCIKKRERAVVVFACLLSFVCFNHVCGANPVPVEDLTQGSAHFQHEPQQRIQPQARSSVSSLTDQERLVRLERQMRQLNQIQVLSQITELQQRIQDMQGTVQKQAFTVSQLRKKLALYEDSKVTAVKKKVGVDQKSEKKSTSSATSVASSAVTAPASGVEAEKADRLYQKAFTGMMNGQYDQALALFKDYIHRYPKDRYAVSSHYWAADIYTHKKQYAHAETHLRQVIELNFDSSKVSDAYLKLSLIYIKTGKIVKARDMLTMIEKKYPHTSAARLARTQRLNLS